MSISRRPASLFLFLAVVSSTSAVAQVEHAASLRGLDPVELVEGKEVEGKEKLSEVHEGYRYVFANKGNQKKFRRDPKRYRIQNQTCLVAPDVAARSELFAVHEKRIYIFATEQCVHDFEADPVSYLEEEGP